MRMKGKEMQQEQKTTIQKFKELKILDIVTVTSSKFINLIEFWIKSNTTKLSTCYLSMYASKFQIMIQMQCKVEFAGRAS